MKKLMIIMFYKKLLKSLVLILIFSGITVLPFLVKNKMALQVFERENNILELEKENSRLKSLFTSFIPGENKIIYEDEYRNTYENPAFTPPPLLKTFPLLKVIEAGTKKSFRILLDDPQYLRPVYDPSWKGFYFRGWIYLPTKNIEARHRIYALSIGGSQNFDITGSLGYQPDAKFKGPSDNHLNINFIVYNFNVNEIKVFENQIALIGEPKRTGTQVVSIVQNDLLLEGTDTKDFVIQLSTPKGYEIDYLNNQNIIRYEYLIKQIEEHTVHSDSTEEAESKSAEQLLTENAALKQELAYFLPEKDETINQKVCNNNIDNETISLQIQNGFSTPFYVNYKNTQYKRPIYHPEWKKNYKKMWSYIPKQIEANLHRLLMIPQNPEEQTDFFGTMGFFEKHEPVTSDKYGFLIYNFNVIKTVTYKNQVLFIGTPSRTGAQILTIKKNHLDSNKGYQYRLVTPDFMEIDCNTFSSTTDD